MLMNALVSVLGAAALLAAQPAFAHDVPGEHAAPDAGKETRQILQQRALPDMPGKNAVMLTVAYAPGQVSLPHLHPGSVFAYVLEGEVESQMKDEPPVRYRAGDSWYELPRHPHVMSRNASATQPAKLLVWLLTEEGEPIAKPYQP